MLIPYSLFNTAFSSFLGGSDSPATRNGTFVYLFLVWNSES